KTFKNLAGEIKIDRTTNTAIRNVSGPFTNQAAITIGAVASTGDYGIFNYNTFNNNACATLTIFEPLGNDGAFTNSGLFTSNTTAAHTNNGTFTNEGIIEYPQGNPIPNVTNNEIIIAPTSIECGNASPAFELGNPLDFTIHGVFTDANATISAGTYDVNTNTFTPTSPLAEGVYNYFVKIEDPNGGCTKIVTWEITVDDTIQPVPYCKTNTPVSLGTDGFYNIQENDVFNGGTDNCGTVIYQSASPGVVTCADVGNTVNITVTANDGNGNENTCTAMVAVEDNVNPIALCQNVTVQLDDAGSGSISATDINNGSNDACGIANMSVTPNSFGCDNLGTNTVTLFVTDTGGNTSECTTSVFVRDNVAPITLCKNKSIKLNGLGYASITVT
ncbi:MAG: hypothetical protein GY727_04660, partial [Gammaproteobacteria bacterium]|nr:hypothetical protein [Gammaproteobacteria bacterium]